MKKLSSYTIAKNCTDITDVNDGIKEVALAIKELDNVGKKIPSYYFKRFDKLERKLAKLEKHIYLVKIGGYANFELSHYTLTIEEAIKLVISVIRKTNSELEIIEPPSKVFEFGKDAHYEFTARRANSQSNGLVYKFCIRTVVVFNP